MKTPENPLDRSKTFELRCQAKRGIRLHPEDQKYLQNMFNKYPDWYSSLTERVFVETDPNPFKQKEK